MIEATEVVKAVEVIEAEPEKSLLMTSESSKFLNSYLNIYIRNTF